MKKIITALANPILNNELKKEKNLKIVGNDIQYQEGIIEILEIEKEIDFLILSEILPGENKIEEIIEKIKIINSEIKIIIILENKNIELENYLYKKGIFSIFYNNQVEIKDIINLIKENKNDENLEIKRELKELRKIISENRLNNKEELLNKKNKLINLNKNKIIRKLIQRVRVKKESNKKTKNKEIICITGTSGVGKSIFSIQLAKSFIYSKNKILIIDFDILNNSLHTMLGIKKYPEKIKNKIKNNSLIKNKLNIKELIIRINKKIDLISGINLLFDSKYKISSSKIKNILEELKEKYDVIIIDTSSECFLDYTKNIIEQSNTNIFIVEANLSEIKKAKNLLKIYTDEWKINKNKINILFNKYNENSIDFNILKNIFKEFNIIGKINNEIKYTAIINKNRRDNKIDKKMRKEFLELNNNLFRKENKNKVEFINNILGYLN